MYLQLCTRRTTALDSPVQNLNRLEKLIVMLLRRDNLHTQRRVQIHTAIDRPLIP